MIHRRIPALILGDLILAVLAVWTGLFLRIGVMLVPAELVLTRGVNIAVFALVVLASSFVSELYNQERKIGEKELMLRTGIGVILSFVALSAVYYMFPPVSDWRGLLALSLVSFGLYQYLWHVSYRKLARSPGLAQRVLILGTGPLATQIGDIITEADNNHVLAGYVHCNGNGHHNGNGNGNGHHNGNGNGNGHYQMDLPLSASDDSVPAGVPCFESNGGGLMAVAQRERAHTIVVSLRERRGVFPVRDVLSCKLKGVEVLDAASYYERETGRVLLENANPSWFVYSDGFRITPAVRFSKRAFDLMTASLGLLMALPLFPLIALAVKLDSSGPVFYRQERLGYGERSFPLIKFRTMIQNAENRTGAIWSQKSDPRITRVGRFLRKTRLDELPQLMNVLVGDMSFVGPRPERPEFVRKLKELIPYYSERHSIKPGITGWAQIKYPYGASVEDAVEKLRYDLFYVKNVSLVLDFLIMLDTVKVVLIGKGAR